MVAIGGGGGVLGGGPSGGGGSGNGSAITAWVKAHGTTVTAVAVSAGTLYQVG